MKVLFAAFALVFAIAGPGLIWAESTAGTDALERKCRFIRKEGGIVCDYFMVTAGNAVPSAVGHHGQCADWELERGYIDRTKCEGSPRFDRYCYTWCEAPTMKMESGDFELAAADSGFTGRRCGPPNRKTGDRFCCLYEKGMQISCDVK